MLELDRRGFFGLLFAALLAPFLHGFGWRDTSTEGDAWEAWASDYFQLEVTRPDRDAFATEIDRQLKILDAQMRREHIRLMMCDSFQDFGHPGWPRA